jgi:hypothetical protein
MHRPVALLDANVLYPARLRVLLIRLAIAGLYQARWSEQILDECFDNLIEDRPDLTQDQLARTRRLMTTALPDASVTGYEDRVEELSLADPNGCMRRASQDALRWELMDRNPCDSRLPVTRTRNPLGAAP